MVDPLTERYRSGRNGGASKASCRVTGPWVRIPPPPPNKSNKINNLRAYIEQRYLSALQRRSTKPQDSRNQAQFGQAGSKSTHVPSVAPHLISRSALNAQRAEQDESSQRGNGSVAEFGHGGIKLAV